MPMSPQRMHLTPDHLARVPPYEGETGRLEGRTDRPSEDDYAAAVEHVLAGAPARDDVRVFAYGSLIWNPEFAFVEESLGTLNGWHRSFCLGWVRIYRGTPERPGIMLALDRGGSCKGVVFRLPPDAVVRNLTILLRREMPLARPTPPCRWVTVQGEDGPCRAIAFPISRKGPAYLPGLAEEEVVQALATAAGERGSMAEYLYSTVLHLAERGIHDRYLWHMQERVAERIDALYPAG
jgi:cation transport protein ChaC